MCEKGVHHPQQTFLQQVHSSVQDALCTKNCILRAMQGDQRRWPIPTAARAINPFFSTRHTLYFHICGNTILKVQPVFHGYYLSILSYRSQLCASFQVSAIDLQENTPLANGHHVHTHPFLFGQAVIMFHLSFRTLLIANITVVPTTRPSFFSKFKRTVEKRLGRLWKTYT